MMFIKKTQLNKHLFIYVLWEMIRSEICVHMLAVIITIKSIFTQFM